MRVRAGGGALPPLDQLPLPPSQVSLTHSCTRWIPVASGLVRCVCICCMRVQQCSPASARLPPAHLPLPSDRRRIPDGCGCTLCCNWPSPKQRHRSINRAACGQPAPCACSACSHAHASAFAPPAKSVRCVRVWGGVSGSGVGWHSLLSAPHSSTFVGQHPEEEMIHPPIPTPAPAPAPAHPTTTHPHTHLCRSTTPRHEHKSFGCFSVPQITYAPKTIQCKKKKCQLLPQYTTLRLGSVSHRIFSVLVLHSTPAL